MTEALQESLESLQEKLADFNQSLAGVERALANQPNEPQLLKLKRDLEEVISLTNDLVTFKQSSCALQCSSTSGGGIDGGSYDSSAQQLGAYKTLVGRTCQSSHDGVLCYGEITQLKRDSKLGERVVVELVGSKHVVEIPLKDIKIVVPPNPALCVPGAKAQAIYSQDGRWYDCVIESKTGGGYKVKYAEYDNEEEVREDRIRLKVNYSEDKNGQQDGEVKRRKVKETITPGGYRIPLHLQINSTDSEHLKQVKRKKIALLKKQQRQEQADVEAKTRASSWQRHNQRTSSRAKTGFVTGGKARASIFQTSELPDAKVGVTNSGKGMTSFMIRQKHVYEEDGT